MTSKIKKIRQGFTLIETLIAVLLLSVAVAGPLTIASRGLLSALVVKDQITAFYLAQDAVEYVRFLRDSACLGAGVQPGGCPAATWLSSLSSCTSLNGSASCYFDSLGNNPAAPTSCGGPSCSNELYYDTTNHYFTYNTSGTQKSIFIRSVSITSSGSSEAVLTVSVSWQDIAGVTHAPVIVRENLFNWQ